MTRSAGASTGSRRHFRNDHFLKLADSRPSPEILDGDDAEPVARELVMGAIDHRQVEELRDAFERHEVRYLFIGKTGAILHGFPDTTQDADLFVQKTVRNGAAAARALQELGFDLTAEQRAEIRRGKDFVQLKNGPFDVDLVFAPDGIERFEDAWNRGSDIEGVPGLLDRRHHREQAGPSNRAKDRETLPRLESFREYLQEPGREHHPRLPDLKSQDRRHGHDFAR